MVTVAVVGEMGDAGLSLWQSFCWMEGSRNERRGVYGTGRTCRVPGTGLEGRCSFPLLRPLALEMVPPAEFHFSNMSYHEVVAFGQRRLEERYT